MNNVQTYFTDCKIKPVTLTFDENQIELLSLIMKDEETQYLSWCNILDEPANSSVVNFFQISKSILFDAERYQIGAVLEASFECYFVLQSIAVSLLSYSECCLCNHHEEREICKNIAHVFFDAVDKLHDHKVSYLLRGDK